MPFPRKIPGFSRESWNFWTFRARCMAVEDLFYAKNARSSLKLGHARGAILAAAGQHDISVFEYTHWKSRSRLWATAGPTRNRSDPWSTPFWNSKSRVPIDASDALATAICHVNSSRLRMLRKNPGENEPMISYLNGTLFEKSDPVHHCSGGGCGAMRYLFPCPPFTPFRKGWPRQSPYPHHVREDALVLFGFSTKL